MIRPIKTDDDYRAALGRIESLMNAGDGTPEADELEVLSTLVDLYEDGRFPIEGPDPVDAIRFRMGQQGLAARDLVPLIGSRSKVSEVLSGKRALTLRMIRALHKSLGIPVEALVKERGSPLPELVDLDWTRFPLNAMASMGWIAKEQDLEDRAEETMRRFCDRVGGFQALPQVLFRGTRTPIKQTTADPYALIAWTCELLARAQAAKLPARYRPESLTDEFARDLVRLSWSSHGPWLAQEFLAKHGIHLVVLPHLPRTHLDGAAVRLSDGTPVVGLTLRYDRIDNFWFCLVHELAHVKFHIGRGSHDAFFDDLALLETTATRESDGETEADNWAEGVLVSADDWRASDLQNIPSAAAVVALATRLRIHPAIVAGRTRRVHNNYRILSRLLGHGQVRTLFSSHSIAGAGACHEGTSHGHQSA
jgi:HTH-type transcriptional regulator/antitoxin HigA